VPIVSRMAGLEWRQLFTSLDGDVPPTPSPDPPPAPLPPVPPRPADRAPLDALLHGVCHVSCRRGERRTSSQIAQIDAAHLEPGEVEVLWA
jgi:hypothetical protein